MCKLVNEFDSTNGGVNLISDLQYDGKRAHAVARVARNAIYDQMEPYVQV